MLVSDLSISTVRGRSTSALPLPVPVVELPAVTRRAVESSRRFKLKAVDASSAELTVGFTWRAFGGRLSLQFIGAPDGSSWIDVTWDPLVGTTLIDYGQGAKDIRTLYGALLSNADH